MFYYKCNDISVIDVKNRHLRYLINMASELQFLTDSLFSVQISPDDSFLLLTERKTPKGYKPKSKLDCISVIYDVESSKTFRIILSISSFSLIMKHKLIQTRIKISINTLITKPLWYTMFKKVALTIFIHTANYYLFLTFNIKPCWTQIINLTWE